MHPDLISIGPLTIHTYGVMIVTGFFAGLGLLKLRVRRYSMDWKQVMDLSYILLISGIAGAKILYWIIFPRQTIEQFSVLFSDPLEFLRGIGSGFVFFGSLIASVLILWRYCRKNNKNISVLMDYFTPAMTIGHAFGRIGCFMAGCCYGKTCSLPWAVTFTDPDSLAPLGVPLHPTQLYESAFLFCLTAILLTVEKFFMKKPGILFWFYVTCYSGWRLFIETLRGDPRGSLFNGAMTSTQAIAALGLVSGILVVMYLAKFKKPSE